MRHTAIPGYGFSGALCRSRKMGWHVAAEYDRIRTARQSGKGGGIIDDIVSENNDMDGVAHYIEKNLL